MTGRFRVNKLFLEVEIPLGRTEQKCLSVAAASRAGLPAFLDRHGSATTLAVPITETRPISIMVTNAIAVAPAFIDSDAVGTHRHFGLGERDRIVRNGGVACERRE